MNKINSSLKILFLSNSIFVFASALLGPLYAVYVSKIDEKVLTVSYSWFAFLASSVIFTYFVGKYGDKVKEKEYLLMSGYISRTIVWFLFLFTTNIQMLIILQILLGVGEALGNPSFDTIFASHLDKNLYITDYSSWKLIEKISTAFATLVGGLTVSIFGFQPLFFAMSILALISFLIVLFQPRKVL